MQNLAILNIGCKDYEHSRNSDRRARTRKVQAQEVMNIIGRLFILNFGCNLERVKEL
jgi:hypothetical protein